MLNIIYKHFKKVNSDRHVTMPSPHKYIVFISLGINGKGEINIQH